MLCFCKNSTVFTDFSSIETAPIILFMLVPLTCSLVETEHLGDLIKLLIPAGILYKNNFVFFQYRTKSIPIIKSNKASSESTTRRIIIYGVQDENGSNVQNFALDITPPPEVIYKSEPGTSDGMNVLGIVIFSATMGRFQTCLLCNNPSVHLRGKERGWVVWFLDLSFLAAPISTW